MAKFKELDAELIWKLLEGQVDVIGPLARSNEELHQNASCPKCGSTAHETMVNPRRPFTPGSILPNKILRCIECRAEYDAKTGLVIA